MFFESRKYSHDPAYGDNASLIDGKEESLYCFLCVCLLCYHRHLHMTSPKKRRGQGDGDPKIMAKKPKPHYRYTCRFSFFCWYSHKNFVHNHSAVGFKVAVDNFCKRASKLTLAVAWDSLGSNSAAAICAGSRFILFVVALSFKSSLNWDETVAGKVAVE